ncbi:MAG: ChuX/HutX family heme-like substrate-binding protein [Bacteroidota bacterium]
METKLIDLKTRYTEFKKENPKVRIRNAAEALEVTEAELLATSLGENVIKLNPDFKGILMRIEEIGEVKAISRNDEVVHERNGTYLNGSFNPHVSLFVGEDIDLRIFNTVWKFAFAVKDPFKNDFRRSIQFFAKDGTALHKIYLTTKSDLSAYEQIVQDFTNDDQYMDLDIEERVAKEKELPDNEIDTAGFQDEWINLKDTHDFYGMVKKYKLTRTQALRHAPEGNFAIKVDNSAMREVCNRAAEKAVPIMAFVGNQGIIQIHTGPIKKLMDFEEWFNVLDPHFNLHVKEPGIKETWIVRKPTEDGVVTSLEVFNYQNELILTLFGKRKPGIAELEEWRSIIQEVQDLNE